MQKKIIHEYMSIYQFLVNKSNTIALETILTSSKILTEAKIDDIKKTQDLKQFIFGKKNDTLFDEDKNYYDKIK